VLPASAGRGLHDEAPGLPGRARQAGGRARARRYHSHPVFAPKPSLKDAENQRNYQALFRCTASGLEPFVGVIVGPFDVQLPTQARGLPRAARGGCRAVAWRDSITIPRLGAAP